MRTAADARTLDVDRGAVCLCRSMSSSNGSETVTRSPVAVNAMRRVLDPFVVREEREHAFLLVECGDGSAEV
jgi:hypothetical protein